MLTLAYQGPIDCWLCREYLVPGHSCLLLLGGLGAQVPHRVAREVLCMCSSAAVGLSMVFSTM